MCLGWPLVSGAAGQGTRDSRPRERPQLSRKLEKYGIPRALLTSAGAAIYIPARRGRIDFVLFLGQWIESSYCKLTLTTVTARRGCDVTVHL
jgi:hypothetical protein